MTTAPVFSVVYPLDVALRVAHKFPTQTAFSKPNPEVKEGVYQAETMVVGRSAVFDRKVLKKISKEEITQVRCKNFISLGVIELDNVIISAERIILVNSIFGRELRFHADEMTFLVNCSYPLDMEITGNNLMRVQRTGLEYVKKKIGEWEFPDGSQQDICIKIVEPKLIDSAIRAIQQEIQKTYKRNQERSDLNKEFVKKLGLKSILV